MSRPKRLANGLSSLPAGTDPEAVRFAEPTGEPVDLEQLAASLPPPAPVVNATEEGPTQIGDLPLFSGQSWESGNAPNTIRVTRVGPVGEGVLGTIDLTATEHDIRSKWGGGEYRLEVCNSRNFVIRGGTKIIKVAGEPMIQSDLYRAEYLAMVRNRNGTNNNYGQQQQQQPAPTPLPLPPLPVALADGGMPGMLGMMMTFLQMQADSQRAALQRENESAAQREAMQFKFFELFSKNNEKKQDTYDPLAQLERLFKLRRLVEGKAETPAEPDATSKIIDALPGVFSEVKEMIQLEKAGKGAANVSGAITPAMIEAVLAHVGRSDDVLILDAPIGLIANKATKRLADANIDPAAVLVHFFTQLAEQPMEAIRASLGMPAGENNSPAQTEAAAPKPAESAAQVAVPA